MAWRRPGDKPLSETMMVRLPTHICVTRPQWVKSSIISQHLYSIGTWNPHSWKTRTHLSYIVNTLRPRQNGRYFPDDILKGIFLNENLLISIKISLKFVSKGPINNISALVQIMAWRRSGDKPLSEPVMVRLLMHICVTRPQWVNIMAADVLAMQGVMVFIIDLVLPEYCILSTRRVPMITIPITKITFYLSITFPVRLITFCFLNWIFSILNYKIISYL